MIRALLATIAAALFASAAAATTLVPAGVGELTRDAAAIARGRVVSVASRWSDDHRSIETIVTVAVETYLKGSFGSTVQFAIPGGLLGRYRTIFVGAPQFAADQRVVVFLAGSGAAMPHLVGFGQGVFRVNWSPAAAAWVVSPSLAAPVGPAGRAPRPLALADFEEGVRALAGSRR